MPFAITLWSNSPEFQCDNWFTSMNLFCRFPDGLVNINDHWNGRSLVQTWPELTVPQKLQQAWRLKLYQATLTGAMSHIQWHVVSLPFACIDSRVSCQSLSMKAKPAGLKEVTSMGNFRYLSVSDWFNDYVLWTSMLPVFLSTVENFPFDAFWRSIWLNAVCIK